MRAKCQSEEFGATLSTYIRGSQTVSNIAPPIPALLKEVSRGKGQFAKRLENKDRLLRWAIKYIDTACWDLVHSHSDPDGGIKDREVQVEIGRLKKWLSIARATSNPGGNANG